MRRWSFAAKYKETRNRTSAGGKTTSMCPVEGTALIETGIVNECVCLCTSAVLPDRCKRLTDVTGSTLLKGSVGGISVSLTDCQTSVKAHLAWLPGGVYAAPLV